MTTTPFTIEADSTASAPGHEYNHVTETPAEFARRVVNRLTADQMAAVTEYAIRQQYRVGELAERIEQLNTPIEDGSDPRLASFWDKAQRYAQTAGFCEEFDRVADALGGPSRMVDWAGVAEAEVTITVPVPVAGHDSAVDVRNGDVNYDLDSYDVANALSEWVSERSTYDLRNDLVFEDRGLDDGPEVQ